MLAGMTLFALGALTPPELSIGGVKCSSLEHSRKEEREGGVVGQRGQSKMAAANQMTVSHNYRWTGLL